MDRSHSKRTSGGSAELPPIDALRTGDDLAWTAAFRYLWPVAMRAARHATPHLDEAEVEDRASEALSQLVDEVDHIRSSEELIALTVTISYRRAISWVRRQSAAKRPQFALASTAEFLHAANRQPTENAPCDSLTPLDLGELRALLNQALSSLNGDTRQILREKIELGLTFEEIGARRGIAIGTLCPKVMHALRKVRRVLQAAPELMKELRQFLR
jgi:RNA polymerase sigma factor (sigma-70 family)